MLGQELHNSNQVLHYQVSLNNLAFNYQDKLSQYKQDFSSLIYLAIHNNFQVNPILSIQFLLNNQAPQLQLSIISSILIYKSTNCQAGASPSLMEQSQTLQAPLRVPRTRSTPTKTSS